MDSITVFLLRDQMKTWSQADVGERIRRVWGKGLRSVGGYRWYLETVGMVKLLLLVKCFIYLMKMMRIRNHQRFGCRVSVVQKKYGVEHYFKAKVNAAKHGTMPNSVMQPL